MPLTSYCVRRLCLACRRYASYVVVSPIYRDVLPPLGIPLGKLYRILGPRS